MNNRLNKEYKETFGEDFVGNYKTSSINSSNDANLFLKIFSFILRLFIAGPKSYEGNGGLAIYAFMGMFLFVFHILLLLFLIFTDNLDFFKNFTENKSIIKFSGIFTVFYMLIQLLRGLMFASGFGHQRNQRNYITSSSKSFIFNGEDSTWDKNRVSNKGLSEFDSTFQYMNSKMKGMSNITKEKYLGEFFGKK
jgi:hypothetical protein